MTRSAISAAEALLVLVDMQDALADVMERRDAVVATAALLARAAAVLGVPVLVTRQYPRGLGDTVPEIREAVGGHTPIDKVAFSCLAEPAFAGALRSLARHQIILAGMETHICVTQTALALQEAGYDVSVVADATCSRRQTDHEVALARLRAADIQVTVAESVLYEALERAGTPEFRAVLELVKAHPLLG